MSQKHKMKNPVLRLLASAAIVMVAACSTVPAYHPASNADRTGFAEQKLDQNHYRVTFQGSLQTSRHEVEDYLLLRAAELTAQEGFTHFVIDEKNTDSETTVLRTYRPAFYGGLHRNHPHSRYEYPYYAYGFDWGHPYDESVREYKQYMAAAYITLTNNPSLVGQRTFKAQEVISNLSPKE